MEKRFWRKFENRNEEEFRKKILESKTIVLKFGTSSITTNNRIDEEKIEKIARLVSKLIDRKNIVIVSSGAVACGMEENNLITRPSDVNELQDLAAEGQPILMEKYRKAFKKYDNNLSVWQILLTHHNFRSEAERMNLIARIKSAFKKRKIPIINTNDPVTNEELVPKDGISFTDNDPLSALVAKTIEADLLVIVSNPGNLGTGGKNSKIKAIKIAKSHPSMIVGICKFEELESFLNGEKVGDIY